MSEEEKAAQLIVEAELDARKGNRREAEQKLFQALGVANKTRNVKLVNKVLSLLRDMGLFLIHPQSIELKPFEAEAFILDVGGGGEGIIGKLNGKQVML